MDLSSHNANPPGVFDGEAIPISDVAEARIDLAVAALREFLADRGQAPTADSWTAAGMRPSEKTIDACVLRNVLQLIPDLVGDPGTLRLRSKFLMAVIDTRWPTLRSSPWMRTQPHLGLSFTIRRINPTTSSLRRGRPGARSLPNAAHFRCRLESRSLDLTANDAKLMAEKE